MPETHVGPPSSVIPAPTRACAAHRLHRSRRASSARRNRPVRTNAYSGRYRSWRDIWWGPRLLCYAGRPTM